MTTRDSASEATPRCLHCRLRRSRSKECFSTGILLFCCTLLLLLGPSQAFRGTFAGRQMPFLSPTAPESTSRSAPQVVSSKHHKLSLRLDHVLHRTSSQFGKLVRQKKLDDAFKARASTASMRPSVASPGEEFAYSPVVDGTGAEVGFEHPIRVTKVDREDAFQHRKTAPEVTVTDMRLNEVILPDMSDNETVISLAKMCYNAYLEVGSDDWMDLGKKVLTNSSFGWSEDGLRGYVFADQSEQLVVIAFKGTTAGSLLRIAEAEGGNSSMGAYEPSSEVTVTGVDTIARDKLNDNLLFSCCCARVSWTWTPVCGCYEKANTCNQTCLEDSLIFEDSYYQMALDLYATTALKYPDSTIWLSGHSLGGAIASLTALTFGVPSVSFEAPGDLLAAKRLHLPMYPGYDHGKAPHWSIGHTADPIFMGSCTGFSSCSLGGYALETKCHIGRSIVYDSVGDKGWRVDVRNHRMKEVLEKILLQYDAVPPGGFDPSCEDCGAWTYH